MTSDDIQRVTYIHHTWRRQVEKWSVIDNEDEAEW
jgi:hypothetical protein